MLDLGRALDLAVVAEGVESAEQLIHLRRVGCALGQGFLFARPAEPGAVGELLDRSLLPFRSAGRPRRVSSSGRIAPEWAWPGTSSS